MAELSKLSPHYIVAYVVEDLSETDIVCHVVILGDVYGAVKESIENAEKIINTYVNRLQNPCKVKGFCMRCDDMDEALEWLIRAGMTKRGADIAIDRAIEAKKEKDAKPKRF